MEMSVLLAAAAEDRPGTVVPASARPSRYESQKRRDWQTFGQYLRNHRPPLELCRCSGAHVLEFLRYLDQFGKTKVHSPACPFFGHPSPPAPCPCPLRQAWGSLDALVGRLRAAFEEHGGAPEANPFAAAAVRLYLREVRDSQAKARGIAYEKKRRRRHHSAANKQAKQQKEQQAPSAAVLPVTSPAERPRDVLEPAPHFLFPHAHIFHGRFLAPAIEATVLPGRAPGVGVAGEDVVLAMAEAHAAGCVMPLSVFH
jgi:hypothetical protein